MSLFTGVTTVRSNDEHGCQPEPFMQIREFYTFTSSQCEAFSAMR